jgi:alpha-galactosidase
MAIHVDASGLFHLQTAGSSYAFKLVHGYPAHLYWGPRLRHTSGLGDLLQLKDRPSFSPNPLPGNHRFSLDTLPQEYPQYGTSDFRQPAFQVEWPDGTRIAEFKYAGHRVEPGKPKLAGLPAVYAEPGDGAETLVLELTDESGLRVELLYTVFPNTDAVMRSARLVNGTSLPVRLLRVMSASVDFHDDGFEWFCLEGAWGRERHLSRRPLGPGGTRIESRRGASGHQLNPFAALLRPGADEDKGDVYGFSLVYSGNFLIEAEVDQFRTARVTAGINPFEFRWLLEPGESFQTPEAVMVYSGEGLGGLSRTYHRLYRTRLVRGKYRDLERPVLVNNWEATYFNFNADKLEAIAKAGADLGIELFVLDDGWFGRRDTDNCSLGDWKVDLRKLPGGLADLADRVNRLGMKFGLWVEPEMVSPDSELYRAHPDWCLHVPGRRRTEGRNQLVLDMSRQDVRDYLFKVLSDVFSSAPVTYVKWDMNRHMTEVASAKLPPERQGETAHRYMLGLYELLERLVTAFPDILFECCSGGGGRFDPGMLYYMPQTWTSDDTDAVERLKIQYGTSIVYPASAMGAHVSAVPNHQVGRITSLEMRGLVAMGGNFGYELDLTKFTEEERAEVRRQVALYKDMRGLVQQGDMYRLKSPFEGNETAWMFVSPDRREATVFHFRVLGVPNEPLSRLALRGLDPERDYRVVRVTTAKGAADGETGDFEFSGESGDDRPAVKPVGVYAGDLLMRAGLPADGFRGDFSGVLYRLRAAE